MRPKGSLPSPNGMVLFTSIIFLFGSVGSEFFEIRIIPTMQATNKSSAQRFGSGGVRSESIDVRMFPNLDAGTAFGSETRAATVESIAKAGVDNESIVADEPTEQEPSEYTNNDHAHSLELSLLWRRVGDCDNVTDENKTIINDTNPCYYQPKSYELNYSTMFLILIPLLVSIFLLCVGYCIRQRIW